MLHQRPDFIARLKRRLRQNRLLAPFIGCPSPAPRWKKAVRRVLEYCGDDATILELGSGLRRRSPNIINLELEAGAEVDVVADGHLLPFKDDTFDAVISEAVLEHVRSPNLVVAEMYRVLKPGGVVCVAVPFLQGYHASPHDYQRWTLPGIVELFAAFSEVESGACAGPTASLHWVFREYVGLLYSFGSLVFGKLISLIVGWLTFPLVLLDRVLLWNPNAHILASAVYYLGKKPSLEPDR